MTETQYYNVLERFELEENKIKNFTGMNDPFEESLDSELIISGDGDIKDIIKKILLN